MGFNILIVDDSEVVRAVVKKTIAMAGIEVNVIHEARNGLEALEKLSAEWIDIVFADLRMPEMDGLELIQKMSENNLLYSIPVVIVSSDRSEARVEELKKKGIRAYLKKPFRPENFRDVVSEVLGTTGGLKA